ncbi:MAG TPA: PAS domain-containing protein [Kofleriaceae bacterium]|nr:PAS domain-containing protein [Kofleriaceae bacterium]
MSTGELAPGPFEDQFFKLSVDLLCVAGPDGYFKRLNPAWEKTLGFTIDELLSRQAIEFVHPDDRVSTQTELRLRLGSGAEVAHFQNRYLCKDGSVRWIEWACSALRAGFVYAAGRDVTEQRHAEELLRRKTAELQAVFTALPDLLFRTDANGTIVDYNAGRTSDLYVPPETFLGKTFAEVLPRDLATAIAAARVRAHQTNQITSFEYDLAVPAGQQRFEARIVPALDGHTVMVVRNVTDRWLAQKALEASEQRLRESERLEATGRLAGGIAHDFNNLMMVVLMYCDSLLKKSDLDRYRPQIVDIRTAGERAASLTRQLLAFARKQILSPTVLDPRAVVGEMEGMLRRLIGEHVTLSTEYVPDIWSVRADRSQLEQVVLNLALNARDAMPQGGTVTIKLANVVLSDVQARELELAAGGQYAELVVADTGMGIAPEARPHIFEPFFTTKGVGTGTGLGLATVYGVVRQSGGAVVVETAPGKGSSFRILLPRAIELPAGTAVSDTDEPRGSETVLVVEDEPVVRRALGDSLRELGYTILEAENADAALELSKAYRDPIHVLLTDIVMPGTNGYELATQFLVSRPATRLIYMSGFPLAQRASSWPAGHFLQKPFQPHRLAQSLREALDAD